LPLLPSAFFLPVIIGVPLPLLPKGVDRVREAMPMVWRVAPGNCFTHNRISALRRHALPICAW
jgi:hypothetical protein